MSLTERKKILIAEGDPDTRSRLESGLAGEHDVCAVATVEDAIEAVKRFGPHVMTLDGSLGRQDNGNADALQLLRLARKARLRLEIIVVAPAGDRELAVRAIELGACDCCVRPFDLDEMAVLVRRALRVQDLEAAADALPDRLAGVSRFENLIGTCDAMRDVFSAVRKVAATDVGVLLTGERGTGKDLIARGVHHLSRRSDGPFVTLDPGATPPEFLEAEIFGGGNGNGTFNGAETVPGRLEQAAGGTLFLPGVDTLSQHLQARLLGFLQTGVIERVGSLEPTRADVRIIAAAGPDIASAAENGAFREDLFYLLGVVAITLPPLRERGEDIALLAEELLSRFSTEHGRSLSRFTRTAVRAMMVHAWPGNIPELENRVRRAVIMASGRTITAGDLGLDADPEREGRTLGEAKDALEHEIVVDALRRAAGNVSRAARSIGVSRSTVYDLIRKYELDVSAFKDLARKRPDAKTASDALGRPRGGGVGGGAAAAGDLDSAEGGP